MSDIKKLDVKNEENRKDLDISYPTYILDLSIEEFSALSKFDYEEFNDDLSAGKVIPLLVENVPLIVYEREGHGAVTISVDKNRATRNNKDVFEVSYILLNAFNIDKEKIQWENKELKNLLRQ